MICKSSLTIDVPDANGAGSALAVSGTAPAEVRSGGVQSGGCKGVASAVCSGSIPTSSGYALSIHTDHVIPIGGLGLGSSF